MSRDGCGTASGHGGLARFASGVAGGVVLTATPTIVDVASGCAPLSGRVVYLWHCDRDGNDATVDAPGHGATRR